MGQRGSPPTTASDAFLGVWTWNVKTGIVVACSDVCAYMDIPSETGIHGVPTKRFCAAIHPDDREELDRSVEQTLGGTGVFAADYRVVSVPHGTVWVRSSGRCFRDPSGNPTHISGYLTRIETTEPAQSGEEALITEVVEHLVQARDAAARLSRPVLLKLVTAVLLEASFQLANVLKRN